MKDFIIITPVKNEEKYLHAVADSVINQTIIPNLWLIVDDGSTDGTPGIISSLMDRYTWVKTIRLPEHPRDISFHYSYVCKSGFDHATSYCDKSGIPYSFIALLDADTILSPSYFESIISEFENDKSLGIASGGIYHSSNGRLLLQDRIEDYPAGTGRVWQKECFFETGGYLVEPSPDAISNIKAGLRGWKTGQFTNIVAVEGRWTSSAEGLWKGYMSNGERAYYLNKHPLIILFNAMFFSVKRPYYTGIPFILGYLIPALKRQKKIEDVEIREYYWSTRLSHSRKLFLNMIRRDTGAIHDN